MASLVLRNNILRVLCVLGGKKCGLILPAPAHPAGSSYIAQPRFGYGCNIAKIDRTGQIHIRPLAVVQSGTVRLVPVVRENREINTVDPIRTHKIPALNIFPSQSRVIHPIYAHPP